MSRSDIVSLSSDGPPAKGRAAAERPRPLLWAGLFAMPTLYILHIGGTFSVQYSTPPVASWILGIRRNTIVSVMWVGLAVRGGS